MHNSTYIPNPKADLEILFEDAHIIAVIKPAGIATHPDGSEKSGTLMNVLWPILKNNGGDYAEHIHRLDKGTPGFFSLRNIRLQKLFLIE